MEEANFLVIVHHLIDYMLTLEEIFNGVYKFNHFSSYDKYETYKKRF